MILTVILAIDEFIPSWLDAELKKLDPADRKQFLAEYEEAVRDGLKRLENAPSIATAMVPKKDTFRLGWVPPITF